MEPVHARIPRGQQSGFAFDVINRGNGRATIFHKAQDYHAFLSISALAKARQPASIRKFASIHNQQDQEEGEAQ